jgi:hypothetical protein
MALILDGSLGITTPAETVTGNTILGDATTDTLNVGNGGLVKDASGNVGIGTASPAKKLELVGQFRVSGSAASGYALIEYGTSATAANNWHSGTEGDGTFRWYNGIFGAGTQQAGITAAGLLQFNSGYGSVATAYGCRAWVNFNGTGTVAIRASGNVSSITDNGTGDYTVNFTTAMPDANYGVSSCARRNPAVSDNGNVTTQIGGANPLTTALRILCNRSDFLGQEDPSIVAVSIFR